LVASAPVFRDFDVLLFKNYFAAVISDFRSAPFPLDLIEGRNDCIAKDALKMQTCIYPFCGPVFLGVRRYTRLIKRGRWNSTF
jgi:hypothetical protein